VTDSLLVHRRINPTLVRTLPFLIFIAFTAAQGSFGESSRYWCYLAKSIVGALMLWAVYPWIPEMRWRLSWDALLVGLAVLALWIGLDGLYPSADAAFKKLLCPAARHLGLADWCSRPAAVNIPWNPTGQFSPVLAWLFITVRLLGSTLVVPPLEEVFYRSFLYRYLAQQDFESFPLNRFRLGPFLITAIIFGFTHYEWLPGILCGLLYQALVLRHGRLGEAISAHAVTNFLLGLWVIWRGAWHFW
jgi:membrane protease YdiL (CAAX protease family)